MLKKLFRFIFRHKEPVIPYPLFMTEEEKERYILELGLMQEALWGKENNKK